MQSNCLKKREDILSKEIIKNNIAYFSFNNRGHELMTYTNIENEGKKLNGGSVFEDVLDGYYDILGAIEKTIKLGFKKIYLQGHSLGCTKIVYTYNRLKREKEEGNKESEKILDKIKGIILLSLVDITEGQKYDLGKEKYEEYLNYAITKEKENNGNELMPKESFIHPISVKTYLRYFKYNEEIDFARFSNKDYEFKELNNINIPLFLRWGNINELIIQKPDELVTLLKNKINNKYLDIGYIDGADHGYTDKEKILAKEIIHFCKNIAKNKK